MGFSTGADKMLAPSSANQTQGSDPGAKTRRSAGGVIGLWGTTGAVALSVLVWLVVDLGGPSQMVSAMYSVKEKPLEWASLRRDVNRLNERQINGLPGEDVLTLKRRVALLEDLLAKGAGASARNSKQKISPQPNPPMGAPRSTASISEQNSSVQIANRFAPLREDIAAPPRTAKGTTRPPTHMKSQVAPERLARATNSAKRSQLAPDIVFGLDLGSYDSVEVLKKRWKRVGGLHRDVLGDLSPRRIPEFSADGRVTHRLIAAPLGDAMEVARRCASLQARSVPCRQTLGIGEPL